MTPRQWRKRRITNASVEADPVDPCRPSPGIVVAKVNSPQRRMSSGNILRGLHHGFALLVLAALLPLAIDANVENDRIV